MHTNAKGAGAISRIALATETAPVATTDEPISVQEIEDVVNEIEADPRQVAVRLLTLERQGRRLDTILQELMAS